MGINLECAILAPSVFPDSDRGGRGFPALLSLVFMLMTSSFVSAAPGLVGGTTAADPGDGASLTVEFQADGLAVALQFDVVFDAGAFALEAVSAGDALTANHQLDYREVAPGRLRLVVTTVPPTALVNGHITNLQFTVDPMASNGDYPLVFEAVIMASPLAESLLPQSVVDGLIRVPDQLFADHFLVFKP